MKHHDFPPELNRLSERVIGAAIEVHRALGPGYPESVYEIALCHELSLLKIPFARQFAFKVTYKGCIAGEGRTDLVIDSRLIVEIKAVDSLSRLHEAQLLRYLRALSIRCGLLLNFNAFSMRDGIRRLILPGHSGADLSDSPLPSASPLQKSGDSS